MTTRPRCPYCNKLAPKLTETIYNPGKTAEEKAAWHYQGNQQVVSRRLSYPWDNARGMHSQKPEYVWKVSVWDGETYRFGSSHPFCNADCTYRFAMGALRAGYRRKPATEGA